MHVSTRGRAVVVAGGLLVALAGAPAAASAATADVAGGATTLKLAPGTAKALDALGVRRLAAASGQGGQVRPCRSPSAAAR